MFNLNIDKDNVIGSRWQELNASHKKELDKNGFKYFRENIAKHYMTDNPGWKGDHIYPNDESGIEQLYQYLESIGVEIDISDAQIGGGMYMEDHNDNIITMDLLLSLLELYRIQQTVDFNKVKTITEIGAGYGRTSYAILKKYSHIKCNIVDIEPAVSVSKYYLKEMLPEADINWYYPEQLDEVKNTDVTYCISGFCEMPMSIVKVYFNYVDKNSKYFYFKHDRQCGHFPDRDKTMYPIGYNWKQIFSTDCPITPRFYEELYIINNN